MAQSPTTWAPQQYGSPGRTRRPWNLAGKDGDALTDVASLPGDGADENTAGVYRTFNHGTLHLAADGSSTVVNVWVANYANGKKWTELKIWNRTTDGNTMTESDITVGNDEHRIVDISGVDLIAFNITGTVYASVCTF